MFLRNPLCSLKTFERGTFGVNDDSRRRGEGEFEMFFNISQVPILH